MAAIATATCILCCLVIDDASPLSIPYSGNIDQKGNLEDDDLLDDESKKHLGALSYLGRGEFGVKDLLEADDEDLDQAESADSGYLTQDSNAVGGGSWFLRDHVLCKAGRL